MDKRKNHRHMRHGLAVWVTALLVLALTAVACDDDDKGSDDAAPVAGEQVTDPAAALDARQQVAERTAPVESVEIDAQKPQLPEPSPSPEPSPQASPSPDATSGFLAGILNNPVGTLEIVNQETDNVSLEVGAIEALLVDYEDPAAAENWVFHPIGLYPSPEVAQQWFNTVVSSWTAEGYAVQESFTILVDNQEVGTGVVLLEPGEPTGEPGEAKLSVLWTNGPIFAEAYGSAAVDFFNQLSY